MRVCIFGIGAVGGYIGAHLGSAGHEISAVTRASSLFHIRSRGLKLIEGDRTISVKINAETLPEKLGKQDLVLVTVKGPSLASVAAQISPLVGDDTIILVAMNGLPWWFFTDLQGPLRGTELQSTDRGGLIAKMIPYNQVIGCVVLPSCSVVELGLVRHDACTGLILGEPSGGKSARSSMLISQFKKAELFPRLSERIWDEVWNKLIGNLATGPISVLTGSTIDQIVASQKLRAYITPAIEEARTIGRYIGMKKIKTTEEYFTMIEKYVGVKTSMLRDAEEGRDLELNNIVYSISEIGEIINVPTPHIDALGELTHRRALEMRPL